MIRDIQRPAKGTQVDLMKEDNFSLRFGTVGMSVIMIIRPHHCQMINVSGWWGKTVSTGGHDYYVTPVIICQDLGLFLTDM